MQLLLIAAFRIEVLAMDILARDGLSEELLSSLSYRSELGISLKRMNDVLSSC